jgi:hypothetical protein
LFSLKRRFLKKSMIPSKRWEKDKFRKETKFRVEMKRWFASVPLRQCKTFKNKQGWRSFLLSHKKSDRLSLSRQTAKNGTCSSNCWASRLEDISASYSSRMKHKGLMLDDTGRNKHRGNWWRMKFCTRIGLKLRLWSSLLDGQVLHDSSRDNGII